MDGLGQISGGALFKPEKETSFTWRALTYTGVIFALAFIVYLGLAFGYKPFLTRTITVIDAEIDKISKARTSDPESRQFETTFLDFYSQASNIQQLLKDHAAVTPVFDLIERSTREDIFFQTIQVDGETRVIGFSGLAKDYTSLASQFAVYGGLEETEGMTITGSRQSETGMIFDFRMALSPSVFKFIPLTVEEPQGGISENNTSR